MPFPVDAETKDVVSRTTADLGLPDGGALRVVARQKKDGGVVSENKVLLKAGTGPDIEMDLATTSALRAALKDALDALAP